MFYHAGYEFLLRINVNKEDNMAVQKSKKTHSKTRMGRAHLRVKLPTLSEDRETGELHHRHHVTNSGYYKGVKIFDVGAVATLDGENDEE